jgi:hypothetical protein
MVAKYSTGPNHHHSEEERRQFQTKQDQSRQQEQMSSSSSTSINAIGKGSTGSRSASIAIRRKRCDWEPLENSILYNEQRYTHATWMMYSRIAEYRERHQSRLNDIADMQQDSSSDEFVIPGSDFDVDHDEQELASTTFSYTGSFPEHLPVQKVPLYHPYHQQQQQLSLTSILTDIVSNSNESLKYESFDSEIFALDL